MRRREEALALLLPRRPARLPSTRAGSIILRALGDKEDKGPFNKFLVSKSQYIGLVRLGDSASHNSIFLSRQINQPANQPANQQCFSLTPNQPAIQPASQPNKA